MCLQKKNPTHFATLKKFEAREGGSRREEDGWSFQSTSRLKEKILREKEEWRCVKPSDFPEQA